MQTSLRALALILLSQAVPCHANSWLQNKLFILPLGISIASTVASLHFLNKTNPDLPTEFSDNHDFYDEKKQAEQERRHELKRKNASLACMACIAVTIIASFATKHLWPSDPEAKKTSPDGAKAPATTLPTGTHTTTQPQKSKDELLKNAEKMITDANTKDWKDRITALYAIHNLPNHLNTPESHRRRASL